MEPENTTENKREPKLAIVYNSIDLKAAISTIYSYVPEVTIKADLNGLELINMDPANVALLQYILRPQDCQAYNIQEPLVFGLNTKQLYEILKQQKRTDQIKMQIIENSLYISVIGSITQDHKIPLLGLDPDRTAKIPELTFKASFDIEPKKFNDIIKAADNISESLNFQAQKEYIEFWTVNELEQNLTIRHNQDLGFGIICEEPQKAKYSTEYLKKLKTLKDFGQDLKISFCRDYPLQIEVKNKGFIFILAPRCDID